MTNQDLRTQMLALTGVGDHKGAAKLFNRYMRWGSVWRSADGNATMVARTSLLRRDPRTSTIDLTGKLAGQWRYYFHAPCALLGELAFGPEHLHAGDYTAKETEELAAQAECMFPHNELWTYAGHGSSMQCVLAGGRAIEVPKGQLNSLTNVSTLRCGEVYNLAHRVGTKLAMWACVAHYGYRFIDLSTGLACGVTPAEAGDFVDKGTETCVHDMSRQMTDLMECERKGTEVDWYETVKRVFPEHVRGRDRKNPYDLLADVAALAGYKLNLSLDRELLAKEIVNIYGFSVNRHHSGRSTARFRGLIAKRMLWLGRIKVLAPKEDLTESR